MTTPKHPVRNHVVSILQRGALERSARQGATPSTTPSDQLASGNIQTTETTMPRKRKTPTPTPAVGTDAWKTFVADAMAKEPRRRTAAERAAIASCMPAQHKGRTIYILDNPHGEGFAFTLSGPDGEAYDAAGYPTARAALQAAKSLIDGTEAREGAVLHVASLWEHEAIVGMLASLIDNQIEEDAGEESPTTVDRCAARDALAALLGRGMAYPATIDLDAIMGAEEKLELVSALEQLLEMTEWDWMEYSDTWAAIDGEQELAPFTAQIKGYNGNPDVSLAQATGGMLTSIEAGALEAWEAANPSNPFLEEVAAAKAPEAPRPSAGGRDPFVPCDGEIWYLINTGTVRDDQDASVYCHLAHPTQGRDQKNGRVPRQIGDYIDLARPLAMDFTDRLAAEVGPANMAAIVTLNEGSDPAEGPEGCASQDFCDANMVMEEAFRFFHLKVPGTLFSSNQDKPGLVILWRRAWEIARSEYFQAYAKPLPMGPAANDAGSPLPAPDPEGISGEPAMVPTPTESPMTKLPSKSRRYTYDRMSAEEFRAALAELRIPFRFFARVSGKNIRRVEDWLNGVEEIPHDVRIMLALLRMPGALDLAAQVTDAVVHVYRKGEEGSTDA